jgi:hypothetical protein
MSPTLLEGVIALILLVVAWQIGLALAPLIFRKWRFMKHTLDDVTTLEEYSHDEYAF